MKNTRYKNLVNMHTYKKKILAGGRHNKMKRKKSDLKKKRVI